MKKILAVVLAVVMLVCIAACAPKKGSSDFTSDNDKYFIGATGPLTGDASSYGISVNNGAKLAIEEINKNGGLNGVEFEFKMIDDEATAEKADTAYDQLFEDGMQVSLGSVTSGSCASFASRAAEDNLFFITPSASAENCIAEDNAFRVCFGDPDQGKLAADKLAAEYDKIGAIYDTSDTYSTGIYKAFEEQMGKNNKTFTTMTFDNENKIDFSAQIEALKDCDVIFCPFYYTEAALVADAAKAKGCDAVIFGCDGFDGLSAENLANKVYYITPFDVNSTEENVVAFVTAYEAKYGEKPDQFAADGYDAVMVIYETMKKAGVDDVAISPDKLCDKLVEAITAEDFVFNGVTGVMTWGKNGAADKKPIIVDFN